MQRNTLITLSDSKIGIDNNADNRADFYQASVLSATDYYAFGMSMKERTWQSESYRYGFNGKENDTDWDVQDYGFRIYKPELGKFLSVDPITAQYPELTPYQFASDSPIAGIDLDGLEHYWTVDKLYLGHVNNANSVENKSIYIVKRADADKVQLEVDKMHHLAQKSEAIGLSIRSKLPLNNDQLLDRANWIVAEGNSFYPQLYAESMQKLGDKLGSEKELYNTGMQDKTGQLDKDKYLSGKLNNKTGASFYETRNSDDKRSDEHWAALEAVVGSLLTQEFPANNWRGGRGKGEMQGEGAKRIHRFLIYDKEYFGKTPTIDEKYKKPPSVNYKRWNGKVQPKKEIKEVNESAN